MANGSHTPALYLPNPLKLGLLALIGVAIASSWLVFPYFVQGQQLLRGAGDESRMIKADTVAQYLTRELIKTPNLEITATYASDEYFQYVDRAAVVGNLRPDRNMIFFVAETVHTGVLPPEPPTVTLRVGEQAFEPTLADGPSDVDDDEPSEKRSEFSKHYSCSIPEIS